MIALSHSCLLLSLGQNSFLHLPSTRKSDLIVLLLLIKYHTDEIMMMVMMMVIVWDCHLQAAFFYCVINDGHTTYTQIINMKTKWKEWRNPFKYLCVVQHSDSTNDCENKLTNLRILSTLLSVPRYFGSEVWLMYLSSKICSCFGKNTFGSVLPLVVFL